jgi:hypothetical protein
MSRLFVGALFMLVFGSRAVTAQRLEPAEGSLEIVQDEKLSMLADQYRKMSLNNPEVDGYRVQIFFDSGSNSKNKASIIKVEFEGAYPEIDSYLSYKEPYYRVRVGNFRTLTEAVGFQKKIGAVYPNSFPVKDKILQ